MQIKDMFVRDIEREIKIVITVGDEEQQQFKQQELEEYVVTKELLRHFTDFFAAYKKGINGGTTKVGVWISGFFGSGKSHFLKMLYYLLSNEKVNGKTALDYFKDGKISDSMLIADMELAASVPTDAILFNIDALNSASAGERDMAIVKVFRKVFDDARGYCGDIPAVADLECELEEQGKYEEFQRVFAEIKGKSWLDARHDLSYSQKEVVKTLSQISVMDEESARNWVKMAINPQQRTISIDEFAKRVKKYIDAKGHNHHVVFLADEIGQFVGSDSRLMLNLQTITEKLGDATNGKVWVIVTSQQDVDSMVDMTADRSIDFSKIQGRFETRLALSSADVDEIIQQRLLRKTDTAKETLMALYENKETALKNLITFTGTASRKVYDNKDYFADIYPFVGYQFDLLGEVLREVRKNSASGRSLSEGERSMLDFFQKAAINNVDRDETSLIPFSAFYDPLENQLDHSHRSVISKAYDNDHINPEHKGRGEVFAIEVLKVLFMLKYVKYIEAKEENIVSIMVSSVNDERRVLHEKVKKALNILENEQLIQHQGDRYIFLTDDEQEINRKIRLQIVPSSVVMKEIAEIVFDEIFTDKRARYPKFNGRYTFGIDRCLDDVSYPRTNGNPLRIDVITAQYDRYGSEAMMSNMSAQNESVVIVLPNRQDFIKEVTIMKQIEYFLQHGGDNTEQYRKIRDAKRDEMKERKTLAKDELTRAMEEADIYVKSSKLEISTSKSAADRVKEALDELMNRKFTKLPYITIAADKAKIQKVLESSTELQLIDPEAGGEADAHAIDDTRTYIQRQTQGHNTISLKRVQDYFHAEPYGFIDDDVAYCLARLLKHGDIAMKFNGEYISVSRNGANAIADYLTSMRQSERLMIEQREKVSDKEKSTVRRLLRELFGAEQQSNDEDTLKDTFVRNAESLKAELTNIETKINTASEADKKYPGLDTVRKGLALLRDILDARSVSDFYQRVNGHRDDLRDFNEDFEDVGKFYRDGSRQRASFDSAMKLYRIYQGSRNFIEHASEADKCAREIGEILNMARPYSRIQKLPELTEKFGDEYANLVGKIAEPIIESIKGKKTEIINLVAGKPYEQAIRGECVRKFDELLDRAEHAQKISDVMSLENEAKVVRDSLIAQIQAAEQRERQRQAREEQEQREQARRKAQEQSGENPEHTDVRYPQGAPQEPQAVHDKPTATPPPSRLTKFMSFKTAVGRSVIDIASESDIDAMLADVRTRLVSELEGHDTIHLTFD